MISKKKMYPAKVEVLSVIFTPFGIYYCVLAPVTYEENSLIIEHAIPRNSLDNGLYSCPRRVIVNGDFVVEYLPKGLMIETKSALTQSE